MTTQLDLIKGPDRLPYYSGMQRQGSLARLHIGLFRMVHGWDPVVKTTGIVVPFSVRLVTLSVFAPGVETLVAPRDERPTLHVLLVALLSLYPLQRISHTCIPYSYYHRLLTES